MKYGTYYCPATESITESQQVAEEWYNQGNDIWIYNNTSTNTNEVIALRIMLRDYDLRWESKPNEDS